MEYVDGVFESIYHGEGRLHFVNGTPQMEYQTSDHLGNTRLVYSDLNGNGIIETPSEILDEIHYYPNGLKMEGYWMNSDKFRYTFNGIEEVNDFGLGVNMATFRTLDPELGRWWSVDPKAENLMGMSPYNSMNASPIMYSDPNGDFGILASVAIGAGINLLTNGIQNTKQNQGFFQGAGKATITGGISGAFSYGIGQGFGATGSFINELGRASAHGLSGGITSELGGGSFGSGFLSGTISSGISSGIDALGGGAFEQILGGGLSGGVGSVIGGGNFFNGFGTGLGVGILNHAAQNIWSKVNLLRAKDQEIIDRLIQAWQESKECFECSGKYEPLNLEEHFRNFPDYTGATHKALVGKGYIDGSILPLEIEFPVHKNFRSIDWGGGIRTVNGFVKSNGRYYDSFIIPNARGVRFSGGITFTTLTSQSNILFNFLFN